MYYTSTLYTTVYYRCTYCTTVYNWTTYCITVYYWITYCITIYYRCIYGTTVYYKSTYYITVYYRSTYGTNVYYKSTYGTTVYYINSFISLFKSRLCDCAYKSLHDDIHSSSKGKLYYLFKNDINTASYLTMDISFVQKKMLSHFWCSCHELMIEKGRHLNIDRDYRFCRYCLTDNIRKDLFLQKWTRQLIKEIMSDISFNAVTTVATFLIKTFELRDNVHNIINNVLFVY